MNGALPSIHIPSLSFMKRHFETLSWSKAPVLGRQQPAAQPVERPRMLAARSTRVSRLQRLTRLMRIAALLPRITQQLQRVNRRAGG